MSESSTSIIPTLTFSSINVNEIHPDPLQPRKKRNEQADKELTESIRLHGVLQPIVVREKDGQYVIVVGERRLSSVVSLGLDKIYCLTTTADDLQAPVLQLIENVQRDDLTPEDLASHLNALMNQFKEDDHKATLRALATITGKSIGWVSEKLALSRLPADVKALKDNHTIKNSRVLIGLSKLSEKNPEAAATLIKEIENGKTVTLDLINEVRGRQRKKVDRVEKDKVSLDDIPSSVLHQPQVGKVNATTESASSNISGQAPREKTVSHNKKVVEIARLIGVSSDLSPEEMLEAFADAYAKLLEQSAVAA